MSTNDYTTIYQWLAAKEKIQVFCNVGQSKWISASHERILKQIIHGTHPTSFRIAPATIRINDTEIEAPITQTDNGVAYFAITSLISMPIPISQFGKEDQDLLIKNGLVFLGDNAAKDAQKAIIAALTSKTKGGAN